MHSNKKLLDRAKLYLILDTQVLDHGFLLEVLKGSVRGGVDIVQLRDKKSSAKEILGFCRKVLKETRHQIPFIVNDRADLALISGADGLHVGQEDIDCPAARKMMGPDKIIGVSCQNLASALKAQAEGADYIGFGSVFKTQTKPDREAMDQDLLRQVVRRIKVPVFPIGGIGRKNIGELIPLGVTRVAVCRDILLAKDAAKAAKELKKNLRG
ncbi:MAG: thiamine phosphate synthase [Candidatus Omnitrophica bacterium]|nr:thiamine phosphate synthase [Candidatus Omnitrophota bacterium]MDE2010218.1 thiamine phosphate synthase [Candidatus Omnitrophota bacterium]MDE2215336.1 thiamine phosphate synthase [Candidatus Omnitrophota bacterium]